MEYSCPCCGYRTLELEPPGTFLLCVVCNWEDDNVQFNDPDYEGGANTYSLRQAQHRYAKGYRIKFNPPAFEKDINWIILPEKTGESNT